MVYRCSVCHQVGHNKATCDLHLLNTIAPVLNLTTCPVIKKKRGRPVGSKNRPKKTSPTSPEIITITPEKKYQLSMTDKEIVSIVSGHFDLPVEMMWKIYNIVFKKVNQGKPLPMWMDTDTSTLPKFHPIRHLKGEQLGPYHYECVFHNSYSKMDIKKNPSGTLLLAQWSFDMGPYYCPIRKLTASRAMKKVKCVKMTDFDTEQVAIYREFWTKHNNIRGDIWSFHINDGKTYPFQGLTKKSFRKREGMP
jgi:hypothetical protein